MLSGLVSRIKNLPKDTLFFISAVAVFSFSQSIIDSTFNNFLCYQFPLSNFERGFLELPRELPGFLVIFFSALFFFLCPRRLAAVSHLIAGIGVLTLGLFSSSYSVMLIWLFILSVGQHLFMPLTSSIGMELAHEKRTGKMLGRINGIRNFAAIGGSLIIFLGFHFFNFNFVFSYILAAAGFFISSAFLFSMNPDKPLPLDKSFILRKEYRLFYWLNILFGTRKQIFLTFAPWVLVSVFHQKTSVLATLLFVGGVIGVVFQPFLGRAIDKYGERKILMGEALILIFVCIGYGFAKAFFSETSALFIIFVCFVLDQMLMSVGMARATYLKKIAVDPSDISKTLAMGVSMDHVFSISIALLSGYIWLKVGYEYVFLIGGAIAFINLISASRIKIKPHN